MATEHNDAVPGLIGECNRGVRRVLLIFPVLLIECQFPEIGQLLRMFFSFLLQLFDVLLALLDLAVRCCVFWLWNAPLPALPFGTRDGWPQSAPAE